MSDKSKKALGENWMYWDNIIKKYDTLCKLKMKVFTSFSIRYIKAVGNDEYERKAIQLIKEINDYTKKQLEEVGAIITIKEAEK